MVSISPRFVRLLPILAGLFLLLAACGDTAEATPAVATPTTAPTPTIAATAIPTSAPVATNLPTQPLTATLPVTTQPATTGVAPTATAIPATATSTPAPRAFGHIITIIMENADYSASMAQPYLAQVAKSGALLSNFYAETHPSYPNYLALTAGSTFGITSDGQTSFDQSSVADLLDAAKLHWKVYAEALPDQACYNGVIDNTYVRKHEPFISFTNIQKNPQRCAQIVNSTALKTDLSAGNLPAYSLYIPDLENDGHDTGVTYGANWLQTFLPPLLSNPNLPKDTVVVVTYDEGYGGGTNQIYTLLVGPAVKSGVVNATRYSHYDILRTVEDNFGLGTLGREDAKAKGITTVWKNQIAS